jgi:Flp pilus assembly protein TadD
MHLTLCRTAAALMLALAVAAVHADELQDINRMMRQGQLPQALERVDKFLAGKPRDAQGRFLKGLVLTEMNRTGEAIQVFAKLSEDYPELPEPYNNLAVLYAADGHLERARAALELALFARPDYATAHENLGDVYLQMAADAYQRASTLQPNNRPLSSKLALAREMAAKARVR